MYVWVGEDTDQWGVGAVHKKVYDLIWKTFIINLVESGGELSAQCDVQGNSQVASKMENNVWG